MRRQSQYCTPFGVTGLCLDVFYNTGQGFAASAQVVLAPYASGIRYTNGSGETMRDVADVNGDGLPDWIDVINNQWMVALNAGDSLESLSVGTWCDWVPCGEWMCPDCYSVFTAPRAWSGGSGAIRTTTTTGNPRYTLIDFFDVDGDGMLDRVNTNSSTAWTAQTNQNLVHDGARPNLLQISKNGLGGTTTLVYGPSSVYDNTGGDGVSDLPFISWVTTQIVHNDGMCGTPCTGHDLTGSYWYQDGRYDATEREFRGFRVVYRFDADNNWTLTTFGQEAITKGKVIEVDTYAGGYPNLALVRVQKNVWSYAALANTQSTQLWLAENDTFTCDQLGGITCNKDVTNALIHYERNDPPDPYGNITHTYSCGAGDPAEACGATAADRVDTYVEYAQAGIYSNVRDKPKHTWSSAGAGGAAFAEKWFFYDGWDLSLYGWVGFGNPTEVYTWLDQTTGAVTHACPSGTGRCTKSTMTYDSSGYGNIIEARDANNIPTVTVYESQALLYPSQVIRYPGNGVTLTTTTVTDYRWGKPTSVTDPNGAVTSYEYDSAGRLSKIKRPLEDPDYYSTLYTYTFGSKGQYSSVRVRQREPNQRSGALGQIPDYLTTTEYFDGLGRHHHSATLRVVDGADQQIITGRTQYDVGGRVAEVDDPYPWAGDPAAPGAGNNGTTSYRYWLGWSSWIDPLGRPQCVYKPDGTSACTLYEGRVRRDADEESNWTMTTFNTYGRVTRKDVNHGYSALYTYTTYEYDSAGRLYRTTQNDNSNTRITIAYDSLGRKLQMTDPDSGTWQYAYDAVGNLVYQEDPKASQHVQFCYDGVNRLTKKFYFGNDTWQPNICGTTAAITYSYDTTSDGVCPLGRLGSVSDTSGSTAFTYDCRGRTTKTTKTVTVDSAAKTAPTWFTYDLGDHLRTTTYPDGEAVTTCYDNSGQPKGLSTSAATPCTPNVYAASAKYDLFGRLTELKHAYA
ncbi:MAG: toxin TcdB middle/N-terminal domain-containing protein, partial [Gemmatimonadaceae bacterium]